MAVKGREQPTLAQLYAIYDQYVKPLEAEHWGEFVAVSPEGDLILGPTDREVSFRARDAWGPGNYVFKVRPRAVGRGSSTWMRRVEAE